MLSLDARGIFAHLDGTATRPVNPVVQNADHQLTEDEQKLMTTYQKELRERNQSEGMVKQQIDSTIPDSLSIEGNLGHTKEGLRDKVSNVYGRLEEKASRREVWRRR